MSADDLRATLIAQVGAVAGGGSRGRWPAPPRQAARCPVQPGGADPRLAATVAEAIRDLDADLVARRARRIRLDRGGTHRRAARWPRRPSRIAATSRMGRSARGTGRCAARPGGRGRPGGAIVRDGDGDRRDGSSVPVRADTLCIHGDSPTRSRSPGAWSRRWAARGSRSRAQTSWLTATLDPASRRSSRSATRPSSSRSAPASIRGSPPGPGSSRRRSTWPTRRRRSHEPSRPRVGPHPVRPAHRRPRDRAWHRGVGARGGRPRAAATHRPSPARSRSRSAMAATTDPTSTPWPRSTTSARPTSSSSTQRPPIGPVPWLCARVRIPGRAARRPHDCRAGPARGARPVGQRRHRRRADRRCTRSRCRAAGT